MIDLPKFEIIQNNLGIQFVLTGRFDSHGTADLFLQIKNHTFLSDVSNFLIDLGGVTYLDTAGAAFICHVQAAAKEQGFQKINIINIKPQYAALIHLMQTASEKKEASVTPAPLSFVERRGKHLSDIAAETKEFITFIGEITWALFQSLRHPLKIRWSDTFLAAERAGVDALPIVALISFIVGLVMAFQAAIPMRMFGAELYVSNLIGIAMVRELGPLMTAIVLAGRSSSAFAAEIGTMRINEEVDALTVMGLDPVRFLIVPRIIASTIITPLLTIFSNLVGMLGGALVITSMGYPIISYFNQIASFVKWSDFAGGLLKCFVFGILIAATGCIRGYQTTSGPSAVGISTTRAVVTGIILIAVFDGAFSIIYYYLGI